MAHLNAGCPCRRYHCVFPVPLLTVIFVLLVLDNYEIGLLCKQKQQNHSISMMTGCWLRCVESCAKNQVLLTAAHSIRLQVSGSWLVTITMATWQSARSWLSPVKCGLKTFSSRNLWPHLWFQVTGVVCARVCVDSS
jgi:hypothetical protein